MLTVELPRAGVRPGVTVLDLGCGKGRHAYACALAGAEVLAVDTSPEEVGEVGAVLAAMRESGELSPTARAVVVTADAGRLPLASRSVDVAVAAEILEHLVDDAAALGELARVLRPGGMLALSVPRTVPEAINWVLSREYHEVEGGHVRIYRRSQLRRRLRAAGFRVVFSHHAHALHTPYWWLRCLVGVGKERHVLVSWYHRFLVYDIVHHPWPVRALERALNPLIGKSVVLYAVLDPALGAPPAPRRRGAPPLGAATPLDEVVAAR